MKTNVTSLYGLFNSAKKALFSFLNDERPFSYMVEHDEKSYRCIAQMFSFSMNADEPAVSGLIFLSGDTETLLITGNKILYQFDQETSTWIKQK